MYRSLAALSLFPAIPALIIIWQSGLTESFSSPGSCSAAFSIVLTDFYSSVENVGFALFHDVGTSKPAATTRLGDPPVELAPHWLLEVSVIPVVEAVLPSIY